jgi:hypothetical protein
MTNRGATENSMKKFIMSFMTIECLAFFLVGIASTIIYHFITAELPCKQINIRTPYSVTVGNDNDTTVAVTYDIRKINKPPTISINNVNKTILIKW